MLFGSYGSMIVKKREGLLMNTETINAISSIADLLIGAFGILTILFVSCIMILSYFSSSKSERKYKINVIKAVLENNSYDNVKKVENAYSLYKIRSWLTKQYGIIEINQKIVEEIRTGDYKKYYKKEIINSSKTIEKLEIIIKTLEGKIKFDDEKTNDLYDGLSKVISTEHQPVLSNFKEYMLHILSFNKGRLYEKEIRISELERKVKKQTIIGVVLGIISFISGIIAIIDFIK